MSFKPTLSRIGLIALVSLFLTLADNIRFFSEVVAVYRPEGVNLLYIASTAIVLWGVTFIVLSVLTPHKLLRPVLAAVLILSSLAAYFMNTYHVVIDDAMLRNALQTDTAEAGDLLSLHLFAYLIGLGIVPAWLLWRVRLKRERPIKTLGKQLLSILGALLLIGATVVTFGKFYTSFFREHKPLRYHTNPDYWIYSLGKLIHDTWFKKHYPFTPVGTDARIPDNRRRTIVIFVVGEAARADHFGLNGYVRDTTPNLSKEPHLVNFTHMYSCGTSTAHSVPCMFSPLRRETFDYEKARATENALDVLKHTGKVALLWRDNNSDSKGVAARIPYESFRSAPPNPVCDSECRDVGMLEGLNRFIDTHKDKHIMIVLHQMGNHGPAYYKRYPEAFETYTPVCRNNRLEQCDRRSIVNAYDNALRYTDSFLARTIALAKRYPDADVAVFYVADHGESLGENGIYLHGLPYFVAPEAQKHVGAFLWLNDTFWHDIDTAALEAKRDKPVSHDWIFHTVLGLFGVQSDAYDPRLDLTR